MKCIDVYLHVCEDLDQNLGTRRCREIKLHLRACPNCRAYLESLKRTVAICGSLSSPPLSAAAHRRLVSALKSHGCLPSGPAGRTGKRASGGRP